MKDLKKPLTYEEQFNKLVSHHMQCEDKDLVIKVLKTKNYCQGNTFLFPEKC